MEALVGGGEGGRRGERKFLLLLLLKGDSTSTFFFLRKRYREKDLDARRRKEGIASRPRGGYDVWPGVGRRFLSLPLSISEKGEDI